MSESPPPQPRVPKRASRAPEVRPGDEPVLPEQTRDDRDVGWGDEPGERDENWYRRERPPHHGD